MASKKKTATDMQVTLVKVEDIKKAEYNPRAISTSAMNGLKASIKKFGFTAPLVINTRSSNLVSGHQRLEAATQLGFTEVPVIYVDLSDKEEKALNITLNNSSITGYFTDDLQAILAEIKEEFALEFEDLRLDSLEIDLKDDFEFKPKDKEDKEISFVASEKLLLQVTCSTPEQQEQIFNEFVERGFKVKVV